MFCTAPLFILSLVTSLGTVHSLHTLFLFQMFESGGSTEEVEVRKDTKHAPDLLEGPDVNEEGTTCSQAILKGIRSRYKGYYI